MDHVQQNLSRDLQPQFHTPPSHIAVSLPAQMDENVLKNTERCQSIEVELEFYFGTCYRGFANVIR